MLAFDGDGDGRLNLEEFRRLAARCLRARQEVQLPQNLSCASAPWATPFRYYSNVKVNILWCIAMAAEVATITSLYASELFCFSYTSLSKSAAFITK